MSNRRRRTSNERRSFSNSHNDSIEDIDEDILEGGAVPAPPEAYDDLDLPPLRLSATRVKERLYNSTSSLQIPPTMSSSHQTISRSSSMSSGTGGGGGGGTGGRQQRYSLDGTRSRSRSPSINKDGSSGHGGGDAGSIGRSANMTVGTSNSSTSGGYGGTDCASSVSSKSIEDVDPDILYDKMGLVELDLKEQQHSSRQLHEHKLQPVSERMSEEMLEDVHAFSDLSISRPTSSVGGSTSVTGEVGSHVLMPLDELDEVAEEDSDGSLGVDHAGDNRGMSAGKVIFTNMENLTIEAVNNQNSNNNNNDNDDQNAPFSTDAPTADAINDTDSTDSDVPPPGEEEEEEQDQDAANNGGCE